jgi:hypothetical protein
MKRDSRSLNCDFGDPCRSEAVEEAIRYCESNPPELREDYQREEPLLAATGMNGRGYGDHCIPTRLSPQQRQHLNRLATAKK